ncbi:MAG: proteasome subunit beta [Candidatus Hodarchaeales archaeon]|jgi:proteasome beta subunit
MISDIRPDRVNDRIRSILEAASEGVKGTTTVGLCASDGVVLICDSRATMGTLVASKTAIKLFQLTPFVGATIAGLVADGQKLMDILKAEAELYSLHRSRTMPVRSLGRVASNLLHSARWFPFIIQIIIGGVDPLRGPQLFAIDPLGSLVEEKRMLATGSGSPIALGLLEEFYDDEEKSLPSSVEAAKIGIRALNAAIHRDIMSGDGLRMAIITNKGFNQFSQEDIAREFI